MLVYKETLPCGLGISVRRTDRAVARPFFYLIEDSSLVVDRGRAETLRSALVCLRWAVSSLLERSVVKAGASIGKALLEAAQ